MTERFVCTECDSHVNGCDILTAPNPFFKRDLIFGCPKCRSAKTLLSVCDEPDCWELDTCGFPTDTGYRRTCYAHFKTGETLPTKPVAETKASGKAR